MISSLPYFVFTSLSLILVYLVVKFLLGKSSFNVPVLPSTLIKLAFTSLPVIVIFLSGATRLIIPALAPFTSKSFSDFIYT